MVAQNVVAKLGPERAEPVAPADVGARVGAPGVSEALGACAQARNVPPDQFQAWYVHEKLNDPNAFLPKLVAVLRACIGDTWVFDPADLPQTESWHHFGLA